MKQVEIVPLHSSLGCRDFRKGRNEGREEGRKEEGRIVMVVIKIE